MVELKSYRSEDYKSVCDFLIELNQNNKYHINWNWARFEWMYEHPLMDKSSIETIGLWWDNGKIVGATIYDMYFGEGFCGVLPDYAHLYSEVLEYAYNNFSDDGGFGVAICDHDADKIRLVKVA